MASIGNPFVGNTQKNISTEDLLQALRLDIINEHEAIIGYEAHAAATTDERVKKTLYHISEEEKNHVGELEQLIYMLNPLDAQLVEKGRQSVLQQQAQNFNVPFQK